MKKVEAVIPINDLDSVKKALTAMGVRSLIASEVTCLGESSVERRVYRGSSYVVDATTCAKVELVVPDELVEQVIAVLTPAAERGPSMDGAILVVSIERALSRSVQRPDRAIPLPIAAMRPEAVRAGGERRALDSIRATIARGVAHLGSKPSPA